MNVIKLCFCLILAAMLTACFYIGHWQGRRVYKKLEKKGEVGGYHAGVVQGFEFGKSVSKLEQLFKKYDGGK